MAQVGLDRHALGAGLGRQHRPVRPDPASAYSDSAGQILAFGQREGFDHVVRQHGDLVARHVHGRHARARDLVDGVVRADAQAGRGDVDADPHRAVVQLLDRERVVDLGGGHVVDRERRHLRQRQIGRRARHRHRPGSRRRAGSSRTGSGAMCRSLAEAMPPVRQHQALRRGLQFVGGRFQRLVFDAVLVRLEQQLLHQRLHRVPAACRPSVPRHSRACTMACCFFFSMPASAARSDCSGAAL